MKRLLTMTALCLFSTGTAHADLRYTTRLEVRTTDPASGSNPSLAGAGRMLRSMVPSGDAHTFVNADAARVETEGPGAVVTLVTPDGAVTLDSMTRTYWRVPSSSLLGSPAAAAKSTYRRTGEFATMLGVRAERFVFTMSVPLPITPPPGYPSVMAMEGELWLADTYAGYARTAGRTTLLPGLPSDLPDGMVLRHILRNPQFGYEVEYSVTNLLEEPIPAALFQIPPDYREVQPPLPFVTLPSRR